MIKYILCGVMLSGCAMQPRSAEQNQYLHQMVLQHMQNQRPYVLPMPQHLNVPQQHTYYCSPYGPNTVQCNGG